MTDGKAHTETIVFFNCNKHTEYGKNIMELQLT